MLQYVSMYMFVTFTCYTYILYIHIYTYRYRVKLRVKANITSGLMAASDSSALALVPLLQAEVRKLRYDTHPVRTNRVSFISCIGRCWPNRVNYSSSSRCHTDWHLPMIYPPASLKVSFIIKITSTCDMTNAVSLR